MKADLLQRKCPYCNEWFTPLRTNAPCCRSKICYSLHKKAWFSKYNSISVCNEKSRKQSVERRLLERECFFCKKTFQTKSGNAMFCGNAACKKKKEARRKKMALEWHAEHGREKLQKHLLSQKATSVDGRVFNQSLAKIATEFRESVMDKWVDAVFDLTDQIHLLFSECQHIRGCSSSLLATCLHEGSPSGCWAMHTLNRQRHV